MRLEIAVRASRDLYQIHSFGMSRYGAARADAYLAEIFARFEHIAEWPLAERMRGNVRPPVRLSRQRAHNILYAVIDETVVVLRVFHHSVNWIDLL